MEKSHNALNDLWMLSRSVAVINYTVTTTFLLYLLSFDLTVTENVRKGIAMIILVVTVVSAYSYRQVQKKFKICESIFGEDEVKADPNVDSCSSFKSELEGMNTFQGLQMRSQFLEKSYVRRFSFPMQSQGGFCYHCNRPNSSKNGFALDSQLLLETDPNTSESENSDGTCCKDSDDIPVILHNCLTDLDDILERVKILNEVYINTDVEYTNQKSSTTFQKVNSDGGFVENEEYPKSKLQSDTQKATDSAENACSFQRDSYKDFGISEKPIQKRKSSTRLFSKSVGVNPSLSKNIRPHNSNFSEDNIKEPVSKSCISDTEKAEPLTVNIPSQCSELCSAVNALPERIVGKKKIELEFFKTSVTRIVDPKASLKNPLRRIPMKQHMLSIPARQYVQENTKKRRVAITSKTKPTISKHSLRIFKMSTTSKNLPIIRRNAPVASTNALIISKSELISRTASMISRNASMISRNASRISRNASRALRNASILRNASMVSRNASMVSRNASMVPRNARMVPRNASMTSRKEPIISSKESFSGNLPPVHVKGLISVDEILISMKINFITAVNEQLTSVDDLLISKFEFFDILNFANIFCFLVDFYDLYPDYNIQDDSEQDEYTIEDLILLIRKKTKTDKILSNTSLYRRK